MPARAMALAMRSPSGVRPRPRWGRLRRGRWNALGGGGLAPQRRVPATRGRGDAADLRLFLFRIAGDARIGGGRPSRTPPWTRPTPRTLFAREDGLRTAWPPRARPFGPRERKPVQPQVRASRPSRTWLEQASPRQLTFFEARRFAAFGSGVLSLPAFGLAAFVLEGSASSGAGSVLRPPPRRNSPKPASMAGAFAVDTLGAVALAFERGFLAGVSSDPPVASSVLSLMRAP